jgi:hypothetical protein
MNDYRFILHQIKALHKLNGAKIISFVDVDENLLFAFLDESIRLKKNNSQYRVKVWRLWKIKKGSPFLSIFESNFNEYKENSKLIYSNSLLKDALYNDIKSKLKIKELN